MAEIFGIVIRPYGRRTIVQLSGRCLEVCVLLLLLLLKTNVSRHNTSHQFDPNVFRLFLLSLFSVKTQNALSRKEKKGSLACSQVLAKEHFGSPNNIFTVGPGNKTKAHHKVPAS